MFLVNILSNLMQDIKQHKITTFDVISEIKNLETSLNKLKN
jgi:hypothetical protein